MTTSTGHRVAKGDLIAGTYRIARLIGSGGMGSVWEAEHNRLPGKKVAIKFLHAEGVTSEELLLRFRREAEIASQLGHPNIVEIHDYNSLDDGTPYLVLELLVGESLDARVARGALSEDETRHILKDVGSALRAAHRAGIVHRDLKPQNVFLCAHPDKSRIDAKVLDFGISKIRDSSTVKTQTSTVLGTPQYMAPEQATGKHDEVDERTDVFALAIMAFEMLAGSPPFTGDNVPEVVFKIVYEPEPKLAELAPRVSADIAAAIHKALSKKPEERFASVEAFLAAMGISLPTTLSTERDELGLASTANSSSTDAKDLGVAATIDSGTARKSGVGLEPTAIAETIASRTPRRLPLIVGTGAVVVLSVLATLWWVGRNERPGRAAATPAASAADAMPSHPADSQSAATTATADAGSAQTADAGTVDDTAELRPPLPPRRQAVAKQKSTERHSPRSEPAKSMTEPAMDDAGDADAIAPLRGSKFPRARALRALPPQARASLEEAMADYRRGDLLNAARKANSASKKGGNANIARSVEVIIRCDLQQQDRVPSLLRKIPPGALRSRLIRYCEKHDVLFEP